MIIDGFSPNLNKQLHIGHFRNLVVGNSLARILEAQPVALLGAALGVLPTARDDLQRWFDLLDYHPTLYQDTTLPLPDWTQYPEGIGDYAGCRMLGDVVLVRSDGRPTYAGYEVAFASLVTPDYYLTGAEQREHFASLGLGKKFLPMGLLLGPEGKLKSREGTAPLLDEVFHTMEVRLNNAADRTSLAFNVLAFNCLLPGRATNLRFTVEDWTNPKNAGMYVSYTQVRIQSALAKAGEEGIAIPPVSLVDAREHKDPSPIAKELFLHCRTLNDIYETERIAGGKPEVVAQVRDLYGKVLGCFAALGLKVLAKI